MRTNTNLNKHTKFGDLRGCRWSMYVMLIVVLVVMLVVMLYNNVV